MPRGPRVDAPGQVHHVMIRGIERRRMFHDAADYENFLARLDRLVPELHFRCFAWVLMPNHVHIALQTGEVPLQTLMARVGTGYAVSFNRRYQRAGHLVQNRYKSRLVNCDEDLLNLVTYIHCNPLRAGLVGNAAALRAFPWSGHGALAGDRPARPFESCAVTLGIFAEETEEARLRLLTRMHDAVRATQIARTIADEAAPAPAQMKHILASPAPLTALVDAVCREHGLTSADLGGGRRGPRVIAARGDVAYYAIRELGLPSAAVARKLGVSASTISRALAGRGDLG